jgi:hypothetical protein
VWEGNVVPAVPEAAPACATTEEREGTVASVTERRAEKSVV